MKRDLSTILHEDFVIPQNRFLTSPISRIISHLFGYSDAEHATHKDLENGQIDVKNAFDSRLRPHQLDTILMKGVFF